MTPTLEAPPSPSIEPSILWYDRPATYWTEALPLGNGRLSAMVFGGVASEHLQFNEESLWSGYPRNHTNPAAQLYLPKVREAVFAGDYALADKLVKNMQDPYTDPNHTGCDRVRDTSRWINPPAKKQRPVNGACLVLKSPRKPGLPSAIM